MPSQTIQGLVYYIKATELPVHAGMPTDGYFIYSDGDLIKRVSADDIVGQIIQGTFEILLPSTVVPTTGYIRYRVTFADTYTNVTPNITVTQNEIDNNWVYIIVKDGEAEKELEPKPDTSTISNWENGEELSYPSVRLFDGVIYRVRQGVTTTNPPTNTSDWEELIVDTVTLQSAVGDLAISIGDLNDLETTNQNSLVDAINEIIESVVIPNTPTFGETTLEGNTTNVKLVGTDYFENKDDNDFAQIKDLESFQVAGLKVKKRPNNLDYSIIQTYDFCEGWISPNLFVNGFWKGADNPSIGTMQIKTNWSNYTEF